MPLLIPAILLAAIRGAIYWISRHEERDRRGIDCQLRIKRRWPI